MSTRQHYVPQFLLRGFADSQERVNVFDKKTLRMFNSRITEVASERDFYSVGDSDHIDAALWRSENAAAPIIQEIRRARSTRGLSPKERAFLAGFTSLQMLRTKAHREQWSSLIGSIEERLESTGKGMSEDLRLQLQEANTKEASLSGWPDLTAQLTKHLLMKDLLLFETDGALPFWISDNPAVMNNTTNPGDALRGTLGLAVRGIEVYLPISSTLTVAFMCPSISQLYEITREEIAQMGFISYSAHKYLRARDTGRPMELDRENVRFLNSLQVWSAERFVFSESSSMQDALEIVSQNETLRIGPCFHLA